MAGVSHLTDREEAVFDSFGNCDQAGGSSVSTRINGRVLLTGLINRNSHAARERCIRENVERRAGPAHI
jgi:hypothetical protein